jgi:hypothetical protein
MRQKASFPVLCGSFAQAIGTDFTGVRAIRAFSAQAQLDGQPFFTDAAGGGVPDVYCLFGTHTMSKS